MTLREIAKIAGVAASTVSLVLNNKPGVHPDTRAHVKKILEENGYVLQKATVPSIPAHGEIKFVRYKSANHINERNEDFFSKLLNGAEQEARAKGLDLGIINIELSELPGLLKAFENQSSKIVGVIFLASELERENLDLFRTFSLPVVFLDRQLDDFNLNTISTCNIAGAYEAVKYLYDLGHRKIGLLRGQTDIGGLRERAVGYRRALRDLNITYNDDYVVDIDLLYETAAVQMAEYLKSAEDLPTAFFAGNDIIAAGCIRGLQQCGFNVPEDISVIGFDDGLMSTFVTPQLSTMHIPSEKIGAMAVDRILQIITGSKDIIKSSIGTSLIARESTAPPNNKGTVI